ncbi:hypothetical protein R1flu_005527 [Riccia fluitans]|uniref:Uncharacterized protein n=1 Tax=Riccia fluitans TaxID=41844 RepID=A0ABD1YTN3_9MARC
MALRFEFQYTVVADGMDVLSGETQDVSSHPKNSQYCCASGDFEEAALLLSGLRALLSLRKRRERDRKRDRKREKRTNEGPQMNPRLPSTAAM